MGLMSELCIEDPTKVDADQMEKEAVSKGLPPEGFHFAVLNGCRGPDLGTRTGSQGYELTFLLPVVGPDVTAKRTVWLPNMGQDEKKRSRSQVNVALWGHRLGVLKKVVIPGTSKHTYVEATPGRSFQDALGTQCIVEVRHVEEEFQDKEGKTRRITKAEVDYAGIYTLDDPTMTKIPRPSASQLASVNKSLSGVPSGGVAATTGQPADQFADL